jgi:hypothetical protein
MKLTPSQRHRHRIAQPNGYYPKVTTMPTSFIHYCLDHDGQSPTGKDYGPLLEEMQDEANRRTRPADMMIQEQSRRDRELSRIQKAIDAGDLPPPLPPLALIHYGLSHDESLPLELQEHTTSPRALWCAKAAMAIVRGVKLEDIECLYDVNREERDLARGLGEFFS